ncbi:MAG TPA: AmmeMemoRadiSam system radical SAM enzyme [Candidatus Aphodovivens avistercoris]|nr:AmmeMemoRadiSam system radical SAM enzyme [Candidatus Aphodovivens avistercoris]
MPGRDRAPARVVCDVCPHVCALREGQTGRCRARTARGGRVVPASFGRVTAVALDPIEKKPLARFRPGSTVLSLGGYGCNLRCPFCQNAGIAQAGEDAAAWRALAPAEAVALALDCAPQGCIGLAYTYNEPLVAWEFVEDCAQRAHAAGLANVLVSNGVANAWVIEHLAPLIDAANIDLKGFNQAFYDQVGGSYEAVRATIERLAAQEGCHLEVTTLVIPGLNDDARQVEAAARWLASLDAGITYHLTRFFPAHRMTDRAPTPLATLRRLWEAARRHLDDVVLGNV